MVSIRKPRRKVNFFLWQTSDVTPLLAPVLLRAVGVIKPPSIAGGLLGAYAPGEPNASVHVVLDSVLFCQHLGLNQ